MTQESRADKSCGILLHISSLPGQFGIGDLGREAYAFVDFLVASGQNIWQVLPLSPVSAADVYSPYSAPSTFAGNPLFISPEILVKENLVDEQALSAFYLPCQSTVDFSTVAKSKEQVLQMAYHRFLESPEPSLKEAFSIFCKMENYWLDDYALFVTLQSLHPTTHWTAWPEALRDREPESIKKIKKNYQVYLQYEQFKQFLFSRQWHALKAYANSKGVMIIGDLPFYVGYNSADVWANPDRFKLSKEKKMLVIAGVPPDYFNAGGQLWNMPIYDWARQQKEDYRWWIHRLKKQLEFFDLLRLDHFRGFSAYWEIPGDHPDPRRGWWTQGPAYDFFDTVQKHFPDMPFIAEDLGDIDQAVYELRDTYKLPGMLVLQFGFYANREESVHFPPNHKKNNLVYTGTHDNNTLVAWLNSELSHSDKHGLCDYLDIKPENPDLPMLLIAEALKSPAKKAIIPMQDYLGLDASARMNTPSSVQGNWSWRLCSEPRTNEALIKDLQKLAYRRT